MTAAPVTGPGGGDGVWSECLGSLEEGEGSLFPGAKAGGEETDPFVFPGEGPGAGKAA